MSSKYRGGSVVKEKQGLFFFSERREKLYFHTLGFRITFGHARKQVKTTQR